MKKTEDQTQTGWRSFLELCLTASDETMLGELFHLFLTPEEKASLEGRCLIVKELLKEAKPQRQIAEDLNVSIAKITRGSNELKKISPQLRAYLKGQL